MKTSQILKMIPLNLLLITGACKGPIHRIEAPSTFKHVADSLVLETNKAVKDGSLECFFRDTLQISAKDFQNPKKILNKIKSNAQKRNPLVEVGTLNQHNPPKGIMQNECDTNIGMGETILLSIHEDKYLNNSIVPVIEKGIFTNKAGSKYYVPVAGYAKINPKAKIEK